MTDIAFPPDSEIRQVIENMIDCIVLLGVQDICSLEEFKTLLIGAIRVKRTSAATDQCLVAEEVASGPDA